ncbi:MAG: FAD-dependent oxidoreductase [Pseudomonadota bacterium]
MTKKADQKPVDQAELRSFDEPLAPIRIDAADEVRTLTALRPYRPSGFVLRREDMAGKVLVHNYGHGGCGVTLSWGCAEMASDLLVDVEGPSAAVLGAGVIGLTTAHVLLRRGFHVTLYAETLPPDTTSDVAGALWFPVTLYDEALAGDEFLARFREVTRRSYFAFRRQMSDPRYGVYWMRFFELSEEETGQVFPPRVEGDDLYLEREAVRGDDALGYAQGIRYQALMIDPSQFLPALLEDIRLMGGQIVQEKFETRDDVERLSEGVIVNCTGYGSKALFNDEELTPVRGQLTLIKGQPDIDYGYALGRGESEYLYMFPRRDHLILGGTKDVGNASLAVDDEDKARMMAGHAEIAQRIGGAGARHG